MSTISAFPTPPSRTSSPDVFEDEADSFFAHFSVFAGEVNTVASEINTDTTTASNAAATATTKASQASTSATNAATSATSASNSATTASTAATNASTSASNAATSEANAAASATAAANTPVAAPTHAASSKATPADADEFPLVDSAASWVLKKFTWSNIKAALKTYFDTLYAAASSVIPQASTAEILAESAVTKYVSPDRLSSSKRTARAWVNFDGSLAGTITPRANFNVGSITKNGTGDYTLNFSSALADSNYAIGGTASNSSNYVALALISKTTTSCRFRLANHNAGGLYDANIVDVIVFGN